MKIIFMGTPDFAVPSLRALIENHDVCAVFTQPDKPKGRGKKLAFSPVKEEALKHSIDVYQPSKIKNDEKCIKALKEMNPDYIIVVAYGQILTKEILSIPKYACINLHASILPKYRGAAPINWAIIKGEEFSGNTTMLMDVGLDTGDMLLKDRVDISSDMTAGELHDILMDRGGRLLLDTIEGFTNGDIKTEKQQDELSCYASMLNKEIAKIDWNKSATDIHNIIRGLNPWPITHTTYKGESMKIFKSEVLSEEGENSEGGKILEVSKNGIKVTCGVGTILITRVQFPNGKPLDISQYLNGNDIEKNIILGK